MFLSAIIFQVSLRIRTFCCLFRRLPFIRFKLKLLITCRHLVRILKPALFSLEIIVPSVAAILSIPFKNVIGQRFLLRETLWVALSYSATSIAALLLLLFVINTGFIVSLYLLLDKTRMATVKLNNHRLKTSRV